MTKSSRQQREHLIEKFLIEKYGTKYIGEINNSARTNFCIAAFDFVGRKIEENWTYKNANQKIPFIYIGKKNWEGVFSSQTWNKFIRGQETKYHSLCLEMKIKLIRNHLQNNFYYYENDKLNDEIKIRSEVKKQKISIYCHTHSWQPINLSAVFWKANNFLCRECATESRAEKNRLSTETIINEWNKLERKVNQDIIYKNNETPIPFFSTKYNWPAQQTWASYMTNKNTKDHDPQDIRTLINKKGYLKHLIDQYNLRNNSNYSLNPEWEPEENIGPRFEIQICAPEFRNKVAFMNWDDFFNRNQKPCLKSLRENQTSYIKEIAAETGRFIPEEWEYDNNAHTSIPFTSEKEIYEGIIFGNSWNQISNGSGFSVQAMVNKREFYTPMFQSLNFSLKHEINNQKSFSQIIEATCSEGHPVKRSLMMFRNSPEGFCKRCNDKSPDDFNSFIKDDKKRKRKSYLYYCYLTDREGNKAKKIGITQFKERRLRFKSSYIYKDIFIHDEINSLNRSEARAIEKKLLLDSEEFKYDGVFLPDSESKQRFEGYSELRKLSLDDEFIIQNIKSYINEIKKKGWLDFWLENFSGKQERTFRKERGMV